MKSALQRYATPLVVAIFLGLAFTGLTMFWEVIPRSVLILHEYLGLTFVVAAGLHLTRNWRSFLIHLRSTRGKITLGVLSSTAAVLVVFFCYQPDTTAGPPGLVIRLSGTSVAALAPALRMTPDELTAKIRDAGFTVTSADQTIGQIARSKGTFSSTLFNAILPPRGQQNQKRQ